MVYGRYNYSFHGVYKPTYNWGAPSCKTTTIPPSSQGARPPSAPATPQPPLNLERRRLENAKSKPRGNAINVKKNVFLLDEELFDILDMFGYFWIYYDILKREMDTFWGLYKKYGSLISAKLKNITELVTRFRSLIGGFGGVSWTHVHLFLLGNKHVRCKPDVAPRLTSGGYEDKVDVITPINIYIYIC